MRRIMHALFVAAACAPGSVASAADAFDWKEQFKLVHNARIEAVAACDDMIAVQVVSQQISIWSPEDGKPHPLPVRGATLNVPASLLKFSKDGQLLFLIAGQSCMRFERRAKALVADTAFIKNYSPLSWSSELQTTISRDPTQPNVLFLHENTAADWHKFSRPSGSIELPKEFSVSHGAISADDRIIAIASEKNDVRIYDRKTSKELSSIAMTPSQKISQLLLSGDGRKLAIADEKGSLALFDAAKGTELFELKGHSEKINVLAFNSDNSQIATGSEKTVRLFDATTGKLEKSLKVHGAEVTAIAFSPNGKQLLTGSADETVRVWKKSE